MAEYNKDKLSVIYDKRVKDFVFRFPRRADGCLAISHLCSDTLEYRSDKEKFPYGWEATNFKDELESRGYDLTTLRFSIELLPENSIKERKIE